MEKLTRLLEAKLKGRKQNFLCVLINMSDSSDVSEYQLVFKMFDKDNTGEINIQSVYRLLREFELREQNDSWNPDEPF